MICEEIIDYKINSEIEDIEQEQDQDQLKKKQKIFEIVLNNNKPHLQIVSFLFNYSEYFIHTFGCDFVEYTYYISAFQVFDSQNMIHKLLKVSYPQDNTLNFQQRIKELTQQKNKQKSFDNEKMIQIFNSYDIIMYNQYSFGQKKYEIKEFEVAEIEMIDLIPINTFINCIKNEEIIFIYKLISQYLYYLKFKYQFNLRNISINNFFIQKLNQNEIKVKSIINTTQLIIYDKFLEFIENPFGNNSSVDQNISELPLKESLKTQLMLIQKRIKIQKSNLVNEIASLAPILIQQHGKDIFHIIQQHPKYNVFSIDDFGNDYFILKVYDKNTKYLLKAERFESQSQAYQIIDKYEQLKLFQSQNQNIFLKIGDFQLICVENGWYVFLEEYLIEQKQNNKLVPLEQIDKIKFSFPQIDCNLVYIYLFLVIRNLKHFEQAYKYGFQIDEILNCKPYVMIQNRKLLSRIKILYSNPFYLISKQKDEELTLKFKILRNYHIYFNEKKPFFFMESFLLLNKQFSQLFK